MKISMALFGTRVVVICLFICTTTSAHATLINVVANWSATINGQGYTNQNFTGDATFTYDDSSVPGSGAFVIDNIPLTSFNQTPNPIGSTSFDFSNVFARLEFSDGVVSRNDIGVPPSIASVNGFTDDFVVTQLAVGVKGLLVSVGTFPSNTSDLSAEVNFVHTPVPEPSSLLLACVAGLICCQRRRR